MKVSYLHSKTNSKKSATRFCRQKTAEDKINVSPNMPCTFLLFKASEKVEVLRTSDFLNRKCYIP